MEDFGDFCTDDFDIPQEKPDRRDICDKCRRPVKVCWCPYLPQERVKVSTKIIILQHPYEESRRLKTAPMIELGLEEGRCIILKGRSFPELEKIVSDPQTLLLFPGDGSVDIDSVTPCVRDPTSDRPRYNLILLDGTWLQARAMYNQNRFLHSIKQVHLSESRGSEYVVRTQPTDTSLSTVETAVLATAQLEGRPDIVQPLLGPLRALCQFQMQFGAVKHHSKQFLIENGLYKRQPPPEERNRNRLSRDTRDSHTRDSDQRPPDTRDSDQRPQDTCTTDSDQGSLDKSSFTDCS